MAVNLSPIWGAGAQLFDNSGNVLSGGKIYTYAAGTTTPATTYTSSNGITANSNPIILNSAGRVPYEIWLTDTVAYKFVLKDSSDTLIATYDNLVGINSNYIAYTAQQEIQTATAGQTVFNLTTMQYQPGTNNLSVFVDGVNQYGPGASYAYVETDSDTVTFVNGLHVGASVKFTTASPVASSATNAENVAYDPPFTGAVGTNVEAKLAQTVSVKDFGAVGDGVTDDTTYIQAALDYVCGEGRGCVHFPAGTYKTTDTLEITSDNISLVGDGVGATFIFPTGDFGDSLYVYPPSAVNLQRFSMRDMSFYQQGETTSGAHVHLVKVNNGKMTDVELTAKYGGLWCESAVNCNFANVSLFSDAEFTTFQGGSYLFKASKHATGVNPAELYFVNCNWRGQNGNNYLNYGALITCCDGIGLINSHIGFCRIGVALLPETNTTALVGVNIAPVSIDTCRDIGLQVVEPSTSYTGTFGGHNFLGGFIYNVTAGNAVSWDCQATSLSSFQNIIVTEIYVHAFQFGNYARVSLRGIDMDSINKAGGSGAGFILNNNTSEITIDGFTIWGTGYTPAAGVQLGTGCRAVSVMNGRINKATFPVINNSYNYGDVIFTNVTNEYPVTAVSPNSSGNLTLPLPNSTYQLSDGGGYGVGLINATSAAYGRVVTLYASGNVSIFDTNNLKINGTFNMTNVDTITLVCDGTNWLEVSRSDNG